MTVRYVPEQYPDFTTALLACVSGDEIVLNTSGAVPLLGLSASSLNNITVRAGTGRTPVLDHSDLPSGGIGLTLGAADGWTFRGIRFRDRNGGSASLSCFGSDLTVEDCVFEGCDFALRGNWDGIVRRCDFRSVLQAVSTSSGEVRFESCRFFNCEVLELLALPAGTVENCTMMRCRATNGLVLAVRVCGCAAQECEAAGVGDALLLGSTECSYNNAWLCTADTLFDGGLVDSNTELDPLHVHPLLDLRPQPGSPLVAGCPSSTELDRFGMAFLSPKAVGAHEAARLSTVSAESLTSVVVSFAGGVPDAEACLDREAWTLTTPTGVQVAVSEVAAFGPTGFRLTVHPSLSMGEPYTLRVAPADYGADEASFTPSTALPASPYPWRRYRNIAAVQNAVGRQFLALVGRADALLVRDFLPGERSIFVNSTLDFPSSGTLWLRDFRVSYISKTDGAFHGVAEEAYRLVAVPAGSRAVLDERSVIPEPG